MKKLNRANFKMFSLVKLKADDNFNRRHPAVGGIPRIEI